MSLALGSKRSIFCIVPADRRKLRESFGFRIAELNDVASLLDGALGDLCAEWERLHDQ